MSFKQHRHIKCCTTPTQDGYSSLLLKRNKTVDWFLPLPIYLLELIKKKKTTNIYSQGIEYAFQVPKYKGRHHVHVFSSLFRPQPAGMMAGFVMAWESESRHDCIAHTAASTTYHLRAPTSWVEYNLFKDGLKLSPFWYQSSHRVWSHLALCWLQGVTVITLISQS